MLSGVGARLPLRESLLDCTEYVCGDGVDVTARVDDDVAVRSGRRVVEERSAHGRVEVMVECIEMVLFAADSGPLTGHRGVRIEDDREIGAHPFGRPRRQRHDLVVSQIAARRLVRAGGIDVAVRDDDAAAIDDGTDE